MSHKCSFCKKYSSQVKEAMICEDCAKGRAGDKWCDFCNHSTSTDIAWICDKCAEGRVGDTKCDFCNKGYKKAFVARICSRCER